MLNVEQRFMIKDLYRQGVSISEIARQTGHDRKTIRAVLKEPLTQMGRAGAFEQKPTVLNSGHPCAY